MKILFTGGGTGGHVYPALAVADKIKAKKEEDEILFVGTKEGIEADIVPRAGYELETIPAEGFPRRITWRWLRTFWKAGKGFIRARSIVREFSPDVVVGTGGYVSGPTVLAAALRGVPTVVHEQNAYPGLTNRMLARIVDKVALTTGEAADYFPEKEKLVLTGNPVRPAVLSKSEAAAFKELDLTPRRKVILIVGGSRGAKSINQAVVDSYSEFKETGWQLIHVAGKRDFPWVKEKAKSQGIEKLDTGKIRVKSYLYNMEAALAASDLIISRAGATIMAEITACGLPAILIPYPHAAENHQEHNARALEKAGGAKVVLDKELTGEKLFSILKEVVNETKLKRMAKASKKLGRPGAAEKMVDLIMDVKQKS